mmetsp:Transcript_30954/g.30428  ORF Transcript_30954/g.30428 Transcript_30954/m.30428 type:complete len:124 (+) Transcript_30954:628-999(+)
MLLCRCSYFQAMFTSEMKEKTQEKIKIESISYQVFLHLLRYLYTDDCDINLENAMELFEAADIFGIDRLKMMCEQTIMSNIDIDNAAAIFQASDMHNATSLRERSLNFVLHNFDEVSKTEGFE